MATTTAAATAGRGGLPPVPQTGVIRFLPSTTAAAAAAAAAEAAEQQERQQGAVAIGNWMEVEEDGVSAQQGGHPPPSSANEVPGLGVVCV